MYLYDAPGQCCLCGVDVVMKCTRSADELIFYGTPRVQQGTVHWHTASKIRQQFCIL